MKTDFQKRLDDLLCTLSAQKERPTLLLHACCAPCSSYVLEYLCEFFKITLLYYNPNIYPKEEYERRLLELVQFLPRFETNLKKQITLVQSDYEPQEFYDALNILSEPELANEAEKGERCRRCYEFRLLKAYKYAKSHNFDYLCTTLSISPFKDAKKINEIGEELCGAEDGVKWLFSDFKKKNGFKRSLELSKEYGLYRQQYCGCVFSKKNAESCCAQLTT